MVLETAARHATWDNGIVSSHASAGGMDQKAGDARTVSRNTVNDTISNCFCYARHTTVEMLYGVQCPASQGVRLEPRKGNKLCLLLAQIRVSGKLRFVGLRSVLAGTVSFARCLFLSTSRDSPARSITPHSTNLSPSSLRRTSGSRTSTQTTSDQEQRVIIRNTYSERFSVSG